MADNEPEITDESWAALEEWDREREQEDAIVRSVSEMIESGHGEEGESYENADRPDVDDDTDPE